MIDRQRRHRRRELRDKGGRREKRKIETKAERKGKEGLWDVILFAFSGFPFSEGEKKR